MNLFEWKYAVEGQSKINKGVDPFPAGFGMVVWTAGEMAGVAVLWHVSLWTRHLVII